MKNKNEIIYLIVFGERAKELRLGKHWSIQTLADTCGLGIGLISEIERGKRSIRPKTQRKLFKGLAITSFQFQNTDAFRKIESTTFRICPMDICCGKCFNKDSSPS